MSDAVRITELSHRYPAAARPTLDRVSLSVPAGTTCAVLGPNGGGKTTLFRVLCTALTPAGGSVQILGLDRAREPQAIRGKIGVVFQNPSLDKKLTLRENLRHQGRLYGLKGADLSARIEDVFKRLSISDRADEWVEKLSGGLQRRGEIAKALLHRPSLLLLDEPSTGLDPRARRDMWDILNQLKRDGTTVLLTTHFMDEAEQCDRVFILDRGRLVTEGTPDELKKRVGGDVVLVHAAESGELADSIRSKFGSQSLPVNGTVRIEMPDGHKFVPLLVEAFPGRIESVSVGKPTLEDVFVRETGHSFGEEEPAR